MNKITQARLLGWGQLVVVYLNQALTQNGGVIPTSKAQWLTLASSLLVAVGVHIGSGTSAGHPDGSNTQKGFARGPALVLALVFCLLPFAFMGCHKVNSNNPAVIQEASLLNARKTVNAVAHGIKAANDTVDGLATNEPAYFSFVHPKLVVLAQLTAQADLCVTTAESGGTCDWKTEIVNIAQAVANNPAALTTFGFKNPKSQQTAQLGFKALADAIQLAAQFGGQ